MTRTAALSKQRRSSGEPLVRPVDRYDRDFYRPRFMAYLLLWNSGVLDLEHPFELGLLQFFDRHRTEIVTMLESPPSDGGGRFHELMEVLELHLALFHEFYAKVPEALMKQYEIHMGKRPASLPEIEMDRIAATSTKIRNFLATNGDLVQMTARERERLSATLRNLCAWAHDSFYASRTAAQYCRQQQDYLDKEATLRAQLHDALEKNEELEARLDRLVRSMGASSTRSKI